MVNGIRQYITQEINRPTAQHKMENGIGGRQVGINVTAQGHPDQPAPLIFGHQQRMENWCQQIQGQDTGDKPQRAMSEKGTEAKCFKEQ